jgi:anaerobic ribonucleoside-triphosphate reductase
MFLENKGRDVMKNEENKKLVIPTEVYSRIVGYYRPVQHWNIGKQQEFSERNTYEEKLLSK